MASVREQFAQDAASRGKYAPLYRHLSVKSVNRWQTSFSEVEEILGFKLPPSARLYRPWWANRQKDASHSHALAWQAAGWKTLNVDLEAETLVFARVDASPASAAGPEITKEVDLDTLWPTIPGGAWPKDFTVSRDQIYDEFGRLNGGPEDNSRNGS